MKRIDWIKHSCLKWYHVLFFSNQLFFSPISISTSSEFLCYEWQHEGRSVYSPCSFLYGNACITSRFSFYHYHFGLLGCTLKELTSRSSSPTRPLSSVSFPSQAESQVVDADHFATRNSKSLPHSWNPSSLRMLHLCLFINTFEERTAKYHNHLKYIRTCTI